ncbi:MAG: proton-conducting transporter membrane subunit, partial [Balneolales bacterium]
MIVILLVILLTALCIPLLHRILGNKTAYLLALLPLSAFGWFMAQYFGGVLDEPLRSSLEWNSYFNLRLDFYLDGLSLLFALMITGIGTLIYFYAAYYMKVTDHYSRFFIFLTVFMASMLGLVLADNLLSIIVFWEMTSITSFMLIGYNHEKESARYAALQGLLVTAAGGLALLAGLVLIGVTTGENSISEMQHCRETLINHKLYLPILLCVLTGAFTKSAQVPFHFWLPNAMAAPTPVSAYLHSATMVKAGVYFVARFFPVLGDTFEWSLILTTFGTLTMLTGAIMAFRSDDLKKILAYSTISALGIMVLSFGIGTKAAIYAGMAYILAHALYKSALFMLAGIIDKHSGTRLISRLPGNLYQKMPMLFVLVLLAGLSLGGILPFFGFIAKEMLLEMTLSAPFVSGVLSAALLLTGALFVALLLMLTHKTFFKKQGDANENINKASFLLYAAPMLVAALGLFFGLFPNILSHLVSGAAQSLDGNLPEKHLALWHGVNTAFLLSLVSIIAGAGLYYLQGKKLNIDWGIGVYKAFEPSRLYDLLIGGMLKFANWQTQRIQTGRLRYYVMFTLLSMLFLTGFTFFYKAGIMVNYTAIDIYVFEVVLGVIILMA